jgi:hypothetical protein
MIEVTSLWYKSGEDVTHYCGGHEEKEKRNKPIGTQTATTLWFNPTTVLAEGEIKCNACGIVKPDDAHCIEMGG